MCTYGVIDALSRLNFDKLFDVDGSEGYKAHVIRQIYNARVKSCDISEEACKRAKEIFGIDADQADSHHLLYSTARVLSTYP